MLLLFFILEIINSFKKCQFGLITAFTCPSKKLSSSKCKQKEIGYWKNLIIISSQVLQESSFLLGQADFMSSMSMHWAKNEWHLMYIMSNKKPYKILDVNKTRGRSIKKLSYQFQPLTLELFYIFGCHSLKLLLSC